MFTSKPPTCPGRTLALPRKDRDIRYLRPLGNSDIADFISHQENIDTTTPQGKLFFDLVSGFAEFESSIISARVKLGMERARKQHTHLGRARVPLATQRKIRRLRREGLSLNQVSAETGVSRSTVSNYQK